MQFFSTESIEVYIIGLCGIAQHTRYSRADQPFVLLYQLAEGGRVAASGAFYYIVAFLHKPGFQMVVLIVRP